MPKKKLNKTQRREERLRKAKQWLTTYQGSPKKIVKHYRERFHLDIHCAISDLQAIGVEFTQEYLDAVKRSEQARLEKRRMERERRMMEQLPDSDDWFAFIAGYTSGGAAYGLTWEDVGIEQALPYDEKVQLYLSQSSEPFFPDDELAEIIDECKRQLHPRPPENRRARLWRAHSQIQLFNCLAWSPGILGAHSQAAADLPTPDRCG